MNSPTTPARQAVALARSWHAADCAALRGLSGLTAVMVPKAEDPDALAALSVSPGGDVPVIALVETALGLHRAHDLAAAAGVARLAFGAVDFALDAGTAPDDLALLYARSALVVASRAAGVAQPVDGVTLVLDDPDAAGRAAAGEGAASRVDGQMVDVPVLEQARRVLRQAELWSGPAARRS